MERLQPVDIQCFQVRYLIDGDTLTTPPPPFGLFASIRPLRLDGDPTRGRLVDDPIGYEVLQLQGPPADEAEGWAHGRRAVHVTLPQHTQRMGVVEGHSASVTVQTHPQSGGQRRRVRVRQVVGVKSCLALALALTLTVALRKQDLAHADGEEAEGGGVLAVLCPAVMAAVRVAALGTDGREFGYRVRKKNYLCGQSEEVPGSPDPFLIWGGFSCSLPVTCQFGISAAL